MIDRRADLRSSGRRRDSRCHMLTGRQVADPLALRHLCGLLLLLLGSQEEFV